MSHAPLSPGFHPVPRGHLATIVTHLEMTARPPRRSVPLVPGLALRDVPAPDVYWYRELFRRVGEEWLWQSRLAMAETDLAAILHDGAVDVAVLERHGVAEGLLELDFRVPGECELAFFGVTAALQGSGAGRWMMEQALDRVFARGVKRLWVHTCTLDHPAALDFYRRSGFDVTRQEVEVLPDPRLLGLLPRKAGAHVPLAG
ncbi:MAG: GNAT family N-acetyltransferase [Pseudomonadota bacterium]